MTDRRLRRGRSSAAGPAGATAADVLTDAGLVGASCSRRAATTCSTLEPPFGPLGDVSQRRDQVHAAATSSAPTRCSSRAPTAAPTADGDRLFTGEVNNLPSTVGGGGFHADGKLPRFREDDFAPAQRARARSTAPTSSTGRSTTTSSSRTTPRPSALDRRRRATPAPTRSPRGASSPYPMPPGPDMFGAVAHRPRPPTRLGYHPYRAPTGVNSVEYDGRPACNNCGFCGFYGCPIDAKGDPVAPLRRALRTGRCEIRPESYVTDVLLDAAGRAGARRALPRRRPAPRTRSRAAHVVLAARRVRDAAPAAAHAGSATRRTSSAATSCTTSRRFVLGIFPFRLHGAPRPVR